MTLLSTTSKSGLRKDTKFRQYKHKFYGRELTLQGYEDKALAYMVNELKINPRDIVCECENDFKTTLNIRYFYNKEWRHYIPDAYVKSKRVVVEVKSPHTLGLTGSTKRGWSMTCAKARATKEKGYSIILLLMLDDGTRVQLPKGWYNMKKRDVLEAVGSKLTSMRDSNTLF